MGGADGSCMVGDPALDQSLGECQSPPVTQCTSAFMLTNGQSAAQSFTPAISGKLTLIRLRVSNPLHATHTLGMTLVDSGGRDPSWLSGRSMSDVNTNRIATASAAGVPIMGWQDFALETPVDVSAGHSYVIVLVLNGAPEMGHALWGEYNYWQGSMLDSYVPGRAFSCSGGCLSFNEEPTHRDMEFQTYVATDSCL